MSDQTTFASAAWAAKGKTTRREKFLTEMHAVIPWASLEAWIAPHFPKAGRGRHPHPLAEEALYDSEAMRRFGDSILETKPFVIRARRQAILIVSLVVGSTPFLPSTRAQAPSKDTVFVRSGGGEFEPAIEVLRIGGGASALSLGSVRAMAAAPGGGAFVFDIQAPNGPAILRFDSLGRFVRQVGRSGEGPGEYGGGTSGVVDLQVGADGRIYFRTATLNVYSATGSAFAKVPAKGVPAAGSVRPGASNSVYVREGTVPPQQRFDRDNIPFVKYGMDGKAMDTVRAPQIGALASPQSPYDPRIVWSVLSDGRFVVARTDHLGFVVERTRGTSGRTKVDIPLAPVKFLPAEREELQALHDWQAGRSSPGQNARRVVVPETKLPLGGLFVDAQNRIWLRRPSQARKGSETPGGIHVGASGRPDVAPSMTYEEAPSYSVFREDGTLVGHVVFPIGMRYVSVNGGYAWAATVDADDVPVLVKFRLPFKP